MRLYYVYIANDDWGVMVVAGTAREARRLGYKVICGPLYQRPDYIDIRVTWKREAVIPAEITEPTVFEFCPIKKDWLCDAWRGDRCRESGCPFAPPYEEEAE